jgi:hypothetical protein
LHVHRRRQKRGTAEQPVPEALGGGAGATVSSVRGAWRSVIVREVPGGGTYARSRLAFADRRGPWRRPWREQKSASDSMDTPVMNGWTSNLFLFVAVLLTDSVAIDQAAAQRHGPLTTCEELKRHGLNCPAPAQGSSPPPGRYLCYWDEPNGGKGACPVVSFARVGGPCTCRVLIGRDHTGRVGFRSGR